VQSHTLSDPLYRLKFESAARIIPYKIMKFAFEVPAWLGGIKVSVVLFGIPGLVAILITYGIKHYFDLSHLAAIAIFAGVFLVSILSLFFTLVVLSRRREKQ